MTEAAIIEAIRAVGTAMPISSSPAVSAAMDPAAVQAFQQAIAPDGPSPVPFAQQVAETWNSVQGSYQSHLHRMSALSELSRLGGVSAAHLTELQYEVMELSFQQDIVTTVAKKASDAVSTLVKNG